MTTASPTTGPSSTLPTTPALPTTSSTAALPSATPGDARNELSDPAVGRYLEGRAGDVTAALYNEATGTTSLWRPGTAEITASIVKVDILATLLHQEQANGRSPSSSDQALATAMIEQSDNDAATDLWDDVGQQSGISAFDRLLGLSATVPGTDGYWGLTRTTAADQVKLVRAVVQPNGVLDAASRNYELHLMENVEPFDYWGVSGGIPAGVKVALKNGWLPDDDNDNWQVNSIGWIDGDGRDYVLAVLSADDPDEAYGISTIEGLSSLVWSGLAP